MKHSFWSLLDRAAWNQHGNPVKVLKEAKLLFLELNWVEPASQPASQYSEG